MRVTPFSDWRTRFLAGTLGVRLFLASLAVVFGATLVGFIVIRLQLGQKHAWPDDLPPLPKALWISTVILMISSGTMQWALNSARANRVDHLQVGMTATTLLGVAFLVVQANCWLAWLEPVWRRWHESAEYRFALTNFYMLTGLHAIHVVGGLVPMVFVARNAFAGMYSADFHPGVRFCAMYWHFLGGVWLVLFAALRLGA